MTALIVLAIIVILGVVIISALHVFNISLDTKLEPVNAVESEEADSGEASSEPGADDDDPEEMLDLFDYFKDESEEGDPDGSDEDGAEGGAKNKSSSSEDSYATTVDKLTDFHTGRKYLVECKKMLEAARDEGHIYCALYFDFDRFNYINSLKGNAMGDYVLSHTSQHLRRILPDSAQISRVSCDHFTAVFPMTSADMFEDYYGQLRRMCEKIRTDIAVKTSLKISVGFATTDIDSSYDVNVLLARANVARQCVKVTKAEKFEVYEEAMITTNFFGATLMEYYAECQYSDEFVMYFETISDLGTDRVQGCDSLVRWNCEDNVNNPITLETGSLPTNNDKVIYQVCRAMSRWRKASREAVFVFVDVPATLLFMADIDEFILKCLTEFQIDPQTLVLKVHVSLVRLGWSVCSKQFKRFRELGVRICVAGLDTGYSNLEFLSGLPVDFIKLHKSFIHRVDVDPDQLEKCKKMAQRAIDIGTRAVFEGVDTVDQVSAVLKTNIKLVQGRYTGRPASADDMSRILPEHIERHISEQTVILDESQLAKGEWTLF